MQKHRPTKLVCITLLVTLCLFSNLYAQSDTLVTQQINRTDANYIKMQIVKNRLYALTDKFKLVVWDLDRLDTIDPHINSKYVNYTAIAKDRNGDIVLGRDDGRILKLNPEGTLERLGNAKHRVYEICFNSQNYIYVATNYGVYDPVRKKEWSNFKYHPTDLVTISNEPDYLFGEKEQGYFMPPQYSYLDRKGQWWLIASYGEFGGEMEVFDTERAAIVNYPRAAEVNAVQSIFDDSTGHLYLTSGLQHMMNWGKIYRVGENDSVDVLFDGYLEGDTNVFQSLFIGPGAFCEADTSIYFASSEGFFRLSIVPCEKKKYPEFLFNPRLSWPREPMAVGASMSVKQMECDSKGRLVFRTAKDGIGIYDGQRVVFLQ